jgi:hypothetical protein
MLLAKVVARVSGTPNASGVPGEWKGIKWWGEDLNLALHSKPTLSNQFPHYPMETSRSLRGPEPETLRLSHPTEPKPIEFFPLLSTSFKFFQLVSSSFSSFFIFNVSPIGPERRQATLSASSSSSPRPARGAPPCLVSASPPLRPK